MAVSTLGYRKLIQIAAPFAAALLVLSASRMPSQAESGHMLVIPASDGYGFDDCLGANKTCGHVIADAWCEAHGMSAATSFGRADDVTASVGNAKSGTVKSGDIKSGNVASSVKTARVDPTSFIVNCRD